jgi:hypothetical protein
MPSSTKTNSMMDKMSGSIDMMAYSEIGDSIILVTVLRQPAAANSASPSY